MSDRPKPATSKPPKSAYGKGSSSKAASQTSSKQNLEPPPFHTHANPSSPAPSSQGRLSNSARCAISDVTASLSGTVLESLIDRDIFIVPHTAMNYKNDPEGVYQSIANMILIYDRDTRPRWIRSWNREEDLPRLGPDDKYRKELFSDNRLKNSQDFLGDDAANAIISRLPSIIECCDLARTRSEVAVIRGATEMEWRQAWDQLLVKTTHRIASRRLYSIHILCERGLNFPVNPHLLQIRPRTIAFNAERLEFIRTVYRVAGAAEVASANASDARLKQLQTAAQHIDFHWARITALLKRPIEEATATFDYILRRRCSAESLTGICDSLLVVPCKDAGFEIHEALFLTMCAASPEAESQVLFDESVAIMENFHLVISPSPDRSTPRPIDTRDTTKSRKKGKQPTSSEDVQWPAVPAPADLASSCITYLNPFVTDCSTHDGLPRPLMKSDPPPAKNRPKPRTPNAAQFRAMLAKLKESHKIFLDDDLLLVLLFIEFKKAGDNTIHKATNQARSYAAAVLKFLGLLGITNQPTYGLVTTGNRGALYMAMYNELENDKSTTRSSKRDSKKNCLIMEWNVRTYDLANIGDTYELSVFMQSLAEQSEALSERLKILLPDFIRRVKENPDILKWSMCSRVAKKERDEHMEELVIEMVERGNALQKFAEEQSAVS